VKLDEQRDDGDRMYSYPMFGFYECIELQQVGRREWCADGLEMHGCATWQRGTAEDLEDQ
jgi:hypothetical protein